MSQATLTINSRNYGAWSLRGWLLCKFAGLDFDVEVVDSHDPDARAELLLLSPSFLVPRLRHGDLVIWDTLAIAEYLNETLDGPLLPTEALWNECLEASGGPYLFGPQRTMADAMYAPVCTRLQTYDVKTGAVAADYVETILGMPEMIEWIEAARLEPDDVEELEMEF